MDYSVQIFYLYLTYRILSKSNIYVIYHNKHISSINKLKGILLTEAFLISFIGGILGIVLGATFTLPFNTYIETIMGLPYAQPELLEIIKILLIDLIISAAVGPLASIQAAGQISKAETFIIMKESE